MPDLTEQFTPSSFFSKDNVDISFNIQGDMYYKITTDDAFLWSNSVVNSDDSLNLTPQAPIEKGTQLIAKGFIDKENVLYVVVLSGPSKLDQGYILLKDVGNLSKDFVNPDYVPKTSKAGKISLEFFTPSGGADYLLYKNKNLNNLQPFSGFKNLVDGPSGPVEIEGAISNLTPLSLLSKKPNSTMLKVEILAGNAIGKTGYVFKKNTRQNPSTMPNAIKDVSVPIEGLFNKLNNSFATPKIRELTGIKNVNLKDPTAIPALFNQLRKESGKDPNKFVKTNIAYYNEADQTIDIIQPFYFSPPNSNTYTQLKVEKSDLFVEPDARLNALTEFGVTDGVETTKQIYQVSSQKGVDYNYLGKQILSDDPTLQTMAINASECLKLGVGLFEDLFLEPNKIIIDYNPKTVNTPRWGYYTFKMPLSLIKQSVSTNVLTQQAINLLVDFQQGTPFGTSMIHGYLINVDTATAAEIGIRVSDLESRLTDLRHAALGWDGAMETAKKAIFYGKTDTSSEIQKDVNEQFNNLRMFPTFVKSALVAGTFTKEKASTTDSTFASLQIRKKNPQQVVTGKMSEEVKIETKNQFDGLSTISMKPSQVGNNKSKPIFQNPVIETTNQEGNESIVIQLDQGKLCLIDDRWASKVDSALDQIDFSLFNDEVKQVQQELNKKKKDDRRSNEAYLRIEASLKSYFIYVLASIARQGAATRELILEGIPFDLQTNKKTGKKAVSITDFDSLTGPWTMGRDQSGEVYTYTPEYPALLKQLRWLIFSEDKKKAKLNYNFLQIRKFSNTTYQGISNFSSPEYSYIMSLDTPTYKRLMSVENYKDFFDGLYKYQVFYKPRPPVALSSKKKKTPSPATVGDALSLQLSDEEKEQILNELYRRRYKITEQAFGGTGCLPAALKGIETIDDVYRNVMFKANWSLLIAQVVDRFKCELSKLGGGALGCLADFDVMGTYSNALNAEEIITNFPEYLKRESEKLPTAPIMKMIYNRSIPSMPSIDWYACLRGFLLGLLIKIATDLVVAFTQMILSLLDVECDVDFSSCQQSTLDPNAPDLATALDEQKTQLAAAGLLDAAQAAEELNEFLRNSSIDQLVTTETLRDFIRFLAGKMPIANFKALLNGDTPIHIFNHGKLLAQNFFTPVTFTDEQFRKMLDILNLNYDFSAFIAATLFEQIPGSENCPPELFNGEQTVKDIKDALTNKIQRNTGVDYKTASDQAENTINKSKEDLENRISAVCEVLNFASGALNEVNSAPALLAGFADHMISKTVSGLVTQLRAKPYYDYYILKYLYTGDLVNNNPTREDVVTADLSLAYNVLYRNYWLSKTSNASSYSKNYNLQPKAWEGNLGTNGYQRTNKLLKNDSFEREFLQDMLPLLGLFNPFIIPLLPTLEARLFDMSPNNVTQAFSGLEQLLLAGSRELNNPNYFYAWLENILALFPIVDPRRFPAKYKGFVDENYPNAIETAQGTVKLIEKPFSLTTSQDNEGLHYIYSNGNVTLLKLDVGLTEFRVTLSDGVTQYTRDLPQFPEPFFVDEEQDYLEIVKTYNKVNIKKGIKNPQQKIYTSLLEKNLADIDITPSNDANLMSLMDYAFNQSTYRMEVTFKDQLEGADYTVSQFFFKPYLAASSIKKGDYTKGMKESDLRSKLKQLGNSRPPVALFFERSNNILADVFFEDSVERETKKVVDKVEATFKNFYKNITDGKTYDPKAIARALGHGSNDPELFYEAQKSISSKLYINWLARPTLTPNDQKLIADVIKEIINE